MEMLRVMTLLQAPAGHIGFLDSQERATMLTDKNTTNSTTFNHQHSQEKIMITTLTCDANRANHESGFRGGCGQSGRRGYSGLERSVLGPLLLDQC